MPPRFLVPALVFLAIVPLRAGAQSSLTWGPNNPGAPAGGSGIWSTAAANWSDNNGTAYQAWPAAASTVAVFAGTAGTVSLGSAVSAGGLIFGADGYVINPTAGNALSLVNDPFGFAPQISFAGPSQTATVNAAIAGSSGVYLIGGGNLALGGANTLTGTINLARTGVTLLSATGSLTSGIDLAMGSTLAGSGGGGAFTLDNTGASGASAQTLGTLYLYGGDATVATNRVAAQNLALSIGSQQRVAGATVNYLVTGGTNGADNRINLAGAGFLDRGTFFGGSNFAWRDNAGYVREIRYGTGGDSGAVTTNGGTTITGTHVRVAGNLTAQATATFSTLKLSTNGNVTLATTGSILTVGGILKADGGSSTISIGSIRANGSGTDLVIRTDTAADTLTISSNITNNGGSSLTKTGSGTLILSGTNSYAGGTYLNAGTLRVLSLPAGSGSSLIGTGALNFSGGTLQYAGGTGSTTRRFNFLAGGGGIDVTSSAVTLTLNSRIEGANTALAGDALVKSGAGTLVLAGGSNTDNGGLTVVVNAGTVQLAKSSDVFNHAVSGLFINNGGTVQLAGTGGDQIYDGSAVAVNTGGKLDFNGRDEGINALSGGGSVTNNSATVNSTMTLGANYDASARGDFSGVISNGSNGRTMAVAMVGYGTQILSGANTYTGGTAVNGGKLLVNGTGVAGISSGTGLGAVTVTGDVANGSGSTLGGIGAIEGAVAVNGFARITGGDVGTVGALTLRNSLTFAGTDADNLATYLVDIGAGSSDRLLLVGLGAAGLLDLSSTFDQITFNGTADGTSSYLLATYASLSGVFDYVSNLPAGYALQYGATSLSLVPVAVPEPATWAAGLLTLGAIGYSQRRRLRRERRARRA